MSDEANKDAGFAQTAPETAPIEENMTAAEPQAPQAEPTDAEHTVGADAIEAVARESSRGERRPQTDGPRRPQTTTKPSPTVYVGNLFYEVTPDQLERIFSRFGEVKSVEIIKDGRGLSRGYVSLSFCPPFDLYFLCPRLDILC